MTDRLTMSQGVTSSIRRRLAPFRRTIGTTGGLVVATAINSGTGFVFWWIAARTYPQAAVGLAGAAVSVMLLLSQMSVLGLGTTLAGVLHRERRAASLAVTALLAAGLAGIVLGALVGGAVPFLSDELAPIGSEPAVLALFAVGVGLTALSAVLDQVLVAAYRSSHQLLRNAVFSVSRLALLALAASWIAPRGMVIYAAWVAGTALSLAVVAALPQSRRRVGEVAPLQFARLGSLAFAALSHHVLNLSRSASVWLLPVIVTAVLSREANAAFYVGLLLANFIALVGTSATFTLYVVGARSPEELWRQIRLTLGISLTAAVGGTILLTVLGEPLLTAFGPRYAATAYPTVALLALSTLPLVVKDHWIALQRLRGGVGRAAIIGVGTLVVELVAGAVGAMLAGLEGLALARFAVLLVQAVVMAPPVLRSLARPPDGDAPATPSSMSEGVPG